MLSWCGTHGAGVPVWLNRHWVEADARITTGFVEPHFFAGFSGGPKMVAPGLAGLDTVLTLHDAARIGSESATWAVCEGNPVHDDVRAIAAATGVDFAFDVVLNAEQQIVAAFGGEVLAMHAAARALVRDTAMQPVDGLFDVVVTSNSGYPLDQNLYQAVKGMSAAATVVKPGGLIICAAECADGFPDHGSFRAELAAAPSPRALIDQIEARERTEPDQWQVQVLARTLLRARIGVHTTHLSAAELAQAHLHAGAGHRGGRARRARRRRAGRAGVCPARGTADHPVPRRERGPSVRIVAAPDKFRGTATAAQIGKAVARAAAEQGVDCVQVPMSDGGEGMLEAFGGGNRTLTVAGPLGEPVVAPWRLQSDGVAVIESAYACGIALVGGSEGNDAEVATTRGVGELIVAANRAGADRVILGVGGSATTDGGTGAANVLSAAGLGARGLTVCCDVTTRFTDAARVFGPQKGAGEEQVSRLSARLQAERERVLAASGIDLDLIAGSGAAGGPGTGRSRR